MSALAFLRSLEREPIMAAVVHQFYCDESGKYTKDPLTAFCGVCAAESRLKAFDDEWRVLLRSVDLDALHMKQISRQNESCGRRFPIGQTIPEKIELLTPFADCINKHLELGLIQAWDVNGYKQLPMEIKKSLGGSMDPYFLTFVTGMMELLDHISADDRIAIICDDDLNTAWDAYIHYRAAGKAHGEIQKMMVAIAFANDKFFPALQAADFLAFLSRYEGNFRFYGTPNPWGKLYACLVKEPQPGTGVMKWHESFQDEKALCDLGIALMQMMEKK
jgi:Protein of unknown function (DUF3800)